MSKEMNLHSGAVRKLFDLNGKLVRGMDDLKDGHFYVASSGEPFKRVQYVTEENGVPLTVNSTRNLYVPRTLTRGRRHVNGSFGGMLEEDPKLHAIEDSAIFTPTSKGFKIGVFENGEVNQSLKMVLNYRNCKNFEQV